MGPMETTDKLLGAFFSILLFLANRGDSSKVIASFQVTFTDLNYESLSIRLEKLKCYFVIRVTSFIYPGLTQIGSRVLMADAIDLNF